MELIDSIEHFDKSKFKQIFLDHWPEFKRQNPTYDTPLHNSAVQKMLDCGNPEKMGYARHRCMFCGETRTIGFTCKSCFCLPCAKPYMDRWADFIGRRLLPGVTYRHIVLTMPDFLRIWFFRDPALLGHLMRAGNACLRDVFAICAKTQLDIGSIVVLQTAGRPATYNPHLHILVTGGGINPQGQWSAVSYIPFELMHQKWKYYLLTLLRDQVEDPAIKKDLAHAWKDYPKGFVAFVEKGDVPPGAQGLAQYLAKYVVSPPISVRRIESYDGQRVRYWYRDHRSGQIKHETLPVLRFIGRMVQHILPLGFQRIRYFGLHGNVRYAKMRQTLAEILPHDSPPDPRGFRVLPRKPFAQLAFETFGVDPLRCPRCGEIMELELIKHPKYGVIKDYWPTLFVTEQTHDPTESPPGQLPNLERSQHLVQLSLPFV